MDTPVNHILLITHAPLAHALRECALHVFADCSHIITALDVPAHECPEDTLRTAQALIAKSGACNTLVLTDVLGATPCNVAQRLVKGSEAQLLVGANLPMLLRALCYRHESLVQMAERARVGGVQGIVSVGLNNIS